MDKQQSKVDVVVLIAGEGKRLRPLTQDRPKGLICCEDGCSIFHHLVKAVAAQDWDATIIPVLGHGRQKVHEEMEALADFVNFDYVYNPFYASAGPLVSLWLGFLQSKNNQVLVVNGDTLIKEPVLEAVARWLKENQEDLPEVSLCVSSADEFHADDMKVAVDARGAFVRTGKDILPGQGVFKSAGVMSVRNKLSKDILKTRLDEMVMDPQCLARKYYWHNVVDEVKEQCKVRLLQVSLDSWYEIDTSIDLHSMAAAGKEQ